MIQSPSRASSPDPRFGFLHSVEAAIGGWPMAGIGDGTGSPINGPVRAAELAYAEQRVATTGAT